VGSRPTSTCFLRVGRHATFSVHPEAWGISVPVTASTGYRRSAAATAHSRVIHRSNCPTALGGRRVRISNGNLGPGLSSLFKKLLLQARGTKDARLSFIEQHVYPFSAPPSLPAEKGVWTRGICMPCGTPGYVPRSRKGRTVGHLRALGWVVPCSRKSSFGWSPLLL